LLVFPFILWINWWSYFGIYSFKCSLYKRFDT